MREGTRSNGAVGRGDATAILACSSPALALALAACTVLTPLGDLQDGAPRGVGGQSASSVTVASSSSAAAGPSSSTASAGGGGTEPAHVCGDGIIDVAEECDDGNTSSGDGCSECLVECAAPDFEEPGSHHCYRLVDTPAPWEAAHAACVGAGQGWELAAISTQPERVFLTPYVTADRWIGGSRTGGQGYVWTLSTELFPAFWGGGQPSGYGECTLVHPYSTSIYFHDQSCDAALAYLCERVPPGTRCGNGIVEGDEECDSGGISDDTCVNCVSASCAPPKFLDPATGHCYQVADVDRSWGNASRACRLKGGVWDLLALGSAEEAALVAVSLTKDAWTGAREMPLGAAWGWSNGEPFVLAPGVPPWASNEPNGTGPCARLTTNGALGDWNCDGAFRGVCERPALELGSEAPRR